MSLTVRALVLSALVVSAAACAAENSTGPAVSSTASANFLAGSTITRSIDGSCVVTAETVAPFPDLTPPTFPYPFVNLAIEGVCNFKHLGRTTIVVTEQISIFTGTVTNTQTYTAANGDQIMGQFSGTGSTDGVDAVFGGVVTYIGGTGRFQGVTGSSQVNGTSHFDGFTAVGEYRVNGTITY